MWDLKGSLIQLEFGSNAKKFYSSSKKKPYDLLIKQIEELQKDFSYKNIQLPQVSIRDSLEINPDEYCIYIGIIYISENYKHVNPVNVIASQIMQFQIHDFSYQGVEDVFNEGVKFLLSKNYQRSIAEFAKAYYCASLSYDTLGIMINSAINICGIQALNGDYNAALISAKRASIASSIKGFADPIIKYHSNIWLASMYIKEKDNKNALTSFIDAYNYIQATTESILKITSLWSIAYLSAELGNIPQCSQALDIMLNIIRNDQNIKLDTEFCISFIDFKDRVNALIISDLKQNLSQLHCEYEKISRKFLFKVGDVSLSIIQKIGPLLISTCLGNLSSGTFYIGDYTEGDLYKGNYIGGNFV